MFSCSRRLVLRSPSGRARSWVAALSCPGRSAARSGALQTRDRSSLWRSRISDAPLHFVTRCTASGTRDSVGRARSLIHFSNSLPRSRGALFAPGVCDFSFTHPEARGGRSAEKRSGACEAPVRPAHDAAGQALARRLASHDAGRSPLGAPPWRFWAPGAALPSPWAPTVLQRRAVALRIRAASSSQPGRHAWRAVSRTSRVRGYEPQPRDATPRSAFRIVSGDGPS